MNTNSGAPSHPGLAGRAQAARLTPGTLLFEIGKYASLLLGCLIALLPLVVIFIASFKDQNDFYNTPVFSLPQRLYYQNYIEAFTEGRMLQAFGNTLVVVAFSCVGTIIIGTMAAYVLSRFNFRFNKIVSALFLLAALIPTVSTQVATFQIVNGLGLFNTLWSNVILFMGTDIISIYIFMQFLSGIPRDLDEAALMDGASFFRIYLAVILPLLKPAIATVLIIKVVAIYNDFYTPFLYMPQKGLGVISTSLFRFIGPFNAHWQVVSAGVVITIIPTLLVFLFLQKYIYNGLIQGSVK